MLQRKANWTHVYNSHKLAGASAPAPSEAHPFAGSVREGANDDLLIAAAAPSRQGWTLSNDAANEMVARLKKEILQ